MQQGPYSPQASTLAISLFKTKVADPLSKLHTSIKFFWGCSITVKTRFRRCARVMSDMVSISQNLPLASRDNSKGVERVGKA